MIPKSFNDEDPELTLARDEGAHLGFIGWTLLALFVLWLYCLMAAAWLADKYKTISGRPRRQEIQTKARYTSPTLRVLNPEDLHDETEPRKVGTDVPSGPSPSFNHKPKPTTI